MKSYTSYRCFADLLVSLSHFPHPISLSWGLLSRMSALQFIPQARLPWQKCVYFCFQDPLLVYWLLFFFIFQWGGIVSLSLLFLLEFQILCVQYCSNKSRLWVTISSSREDVLGNPRSLQARWKLREWETGLVSVSTSLPLTHLYFWCVVLWGSSSEHGVRQASFSCMRALGVCQKLHFASLSHPCLLRFSGPLSFMGLRL